jgi:hypothetical protein
MQREACGTALGCPAWVRFSVRPRDLIRSWVRAPVGSACRAAQFYGGKVTQACDLTSKLDDDDRDEDREGVYGFESRVARARQFAAEAGLTAYALMAAAEGAVAAYIHITGDKWKPYEPPVAGPATVGQPAKPRAPPSGEAVRAGVAGPRLAAPQFPPDGLACGRTPPVVKTRGGLKKLGDGH